MRSAVRLMIVTGLLGGFFLIAVAADGDPLNEQQKAQAKLMAYRAARCDAIRKLAERIKGLQITSQTMVRDFVAESDTIQTALGAFLSGVKEASPPVYHDDGTCELTMEVSLQEVAVTLQEIHARYYKGSKFKATDFAQITVTNETKILRETGDGAMKPDLQDNGALSPVTSAAPVEDASHLSGAARQYWTDHCTVQGRLMALRAARVEAMRRLAERVKGLRISSKTTVKDFVAESDSINTDMRTFISGMREVGVRYHENEPIVEMDMELPLREIYVSLKQWSEQHYKGDKANIKAFEELIVTAKETMVRETGMGVAPEKYLKDPPTPQVQAVTKFMTQLSDKVPLWTTQTLAASGDSKMDIKVSAAAAAKEGAIKVAEIDARQRLTVQVNELKITEKTTVHTFASQKREVEDALMNVEQGAIRVAGTPRVLEDGTVIVTIEIELKPVWNSIVYHVHNSAMTVE